MLIGLVASASEGEDAFAAIKLTGLGRTEFLVCVNIIQYMYTKACNILTIPPASPQ